MSDSVKKVVKFQGLSISIDRPKGFVQKGVDREGKPWSREYLYDYGFFKKTDGGDGEELDVFVGPDASAQKAFVAVQNKADGSFDEYKTFVGFPTKAAAKKAYVAHIPAKFLGGFSEMPLGVLQSLRNVSPTQKTAMMVGFFDELEKMGTALARFG